MLGIDIKKLGLLLAVALVAACGDNRTQRVCREDGICVEADGKCTDAKTHAEVDCGAGGDGLGTDQGPNGDADPTDSDIEVDGDATCRCVGVAGDADEDCIPDALETNSSPSKWDTDDDGVGDGCEDRNRNGQLDPGEMDPNNADSDGDGIPDGIEDKNHTGRRESGETSATNPDSDNDGIADGAEDVNHNGIVDLFVDQNDNGCWDPGEPQGEGNPRSADSDNDELSDFLEDKNHNGICDPGETCFASADTDCDKLPDGKEDRNHNGVKDSNETDPLNPDTDNDGILDGLEDSNRNGIWDPATETNPLSPDSDGDRIPDGVEDRNQNGVVDPWVDTNGNGCWDAGEPEGESNPRLKDSDNDGLPDNLEDLNRDGLCTVGLAADPSNPGSQMRYYFETCAWNRDTDCDGLPEGLEDVNRDGQYAPGETNARLRDTDLDGLIDGCPAGFNLALCEDKNNNGIDDPGETSPINPDSDYDGLTDGCEVNFAADGCTTASCTTNPLNEDTDGDGEFDGDEDANHNCRLDAGETDPRVYNQPPAEGTPERSQWEVCAAQNLRRLDFARSQRSNLDYKLALEVEQNATTGAESHYIITPFGRDDGDGFNAQDDAGDIVWGHIFQSGIGVVPDSGSNVNRDIYGFIIGSADNRPLDDVLDGVRNAMGVEFGEGATGLLEIGGVTARPAHDNLPNFRVERAQRLMALNRQAAQKSSALQIRNRLLTNVFLTCTRYGDEDACDAAPNCVWDDMNTTCTGAEDPAPGGVPPLVDPVYNNISCPSNARCYDKFSLYVGAVRRPDQLVDGKPAVLIVVALTPNDSDPSNSTKTRLHADRVTRLEDITGGSALARFNNDLSKTCEEKPQTKAVADLLWVIDDSGSMQSIIERLQRAALDARAVLTANSNIVDFRTAMTTTNASFAARVPCPANCTDTCGNSGGTCSNCMDATQGCVVTNATNMSVLFPDLLVDADGRASPFAMPTASGFPLPGGGGNFYFEDSKYYDCASRSPSDSTLDNCASVPGFTPFFTTGQARLFENAGLLGPSEAACVTNALNIEDLASDITCATNPQRCCERLISSCTDGPTVLASQMCDLIRQMGGLPNQFTSSQGATGRYHSGPELGSRSARRLIDSMLRQNPSPTSSGLRYYCDGAPCAWCDVRQDADCTTVPLVTIFLTDEEDFWFKDECRTALFGSDARPDVDSMDKAQLPELCRYADGDPSTLEACTFDYCENANFKVGAPAGYNPDAHSTSIDRSYTLKVRSDCDDEGSQGACEALQGCQWNGGAAAGKQCEDATLACSPFEEDMDVSCVGNPCPMLRNRTACRTYDDFYTGGEHPDFLGREALCQWIPTNPVGTDPDQEANGSCRSVCSQHTQPSSINDSQKTTCVADPRCEWDQSLEQVSSQVNACVPKYQLNDCQPCKRLFRTVEAVEGRRNEAEYSARCSGLSQAACGDTFMCHWSGASCGLSTHLRDELLGSCTGLGNGVCQTTLGCSWNGSVCGRSTLAGFADVGPVYSIVRDKGEPGRGNATGTEATGKLDECQGNLRTWGRGDGQGYRDIAIATQGRTSNVCAENYRDFMQLIITDIVTLSKPYPLSGYPIAATIKVGIWRDNTDQYFEVPRSRTQGFVYDPSTNSLGFKSDPIDGLCATGQSCPIDGVMDANEIDYAKNLPQSPKDGDVIFVSYRYWLPVPCRDACATGTVCTPTICTGEGTPQVCTTSDECAEGYACLDPDGDFTRNCYLDCTPGDLTQFCRPVECGECEEPDESGACVPVGGGNLCICNPDDSQQTCDPFGPNTCAPGWACDESCVCVQTPGCGLFTQNGYVQGTCADALDCCDDFAATAAQCTTHSTQGTCVADGDCNWNTPANRCESEVQPCCGVGENVICRVDETGLGALSCDSTCDCDRPACTVDADCVIPVGQPNAGSRATWQTCEAGFCSPACEPTTQTCERGASGCACRFRPH